MIPTLRRVRKIPLKPSKSYQKWVARGRTDFTAVAWARAPAFAANVRGVLTHRVRHVETLVIGGRESHHHVHYLCGNGCNVALTDAADVLVADPPADRLLCDQCERRAAKCGLPTGDELAGRHVHRGVLVPRQVCHTRGVR